MKALIICVLAIILSSCSDDNCEKQVGMVGIAEWTIPDTVLNFENSQIIVKAVASNGCWSNLYLELNEINEFEYSLKAYGTYESCGACPDIMVYHDTIIDLQPMQRGSYIFNISELPDRQIIDTIIVK